VPVDCKGVDHADFSADGTYLVATCEFSGKLVKVDLRSETVVGYLDIGGSPQDIKLDPQGRIFYVADMTKAGVQRSTPQPSPTPGSFRRARTPTASIPAATPRSSTSPTVVATPSP